ncbi:MAG: APC family permease [Promethearchaeia archaeon]
MQTTRELKIREEDQDRGEFKRHLGLLGATSLGLSAMLGGGIYIISGKAAAMVGPVITFAYLLVGLMTLFTAINYAELSCSIPKQGGGYTFAHDTYGGFPAFLTGWFLFFGNLVACSLFAVSVAHTICVFIPGGNQQTVAIVAVIIVIITLITNIFSVEGVSGMLGILNIAQSVVLFSFIGIGLFFVQPSNLEPLVAPGTGLYEFMSVISFIYISFVGFELITTATQEVKEPSHNVPRAIMLTLLISTAIYMFTSVVMVGVVPYTDLADPVMPLSYVFGEMLGPGAFYFGLAGMAASGYAALSATFMATARVVYSLGRDNYFPSILKRVSQRFNTPIAALTLTMIAVSAFAVSGTVEFLAGVADFGYLVGIAIVNSSVIVLHRKGLSVPDTFQAGFFPAIPILGVVTCLMLVPTLHMEALILGGALTVMGILVYLLYSRRKKKSHHRKIIITTVLCQA